MCAVEVDNLYFRSVAEIGWIHFTAIFHKVNTIFFLSEIRLVFMSNGQILKLSFDSFFSVVGKFEGQI